MHEQLNVLAVFLNKSQTRISATPVAGPYGTELSSKAGSTH